MHMLCDAGQWRFNLVLVVIFWLELFGTYAAPRAAQRPLENWLSPPALLGQQ
jgi:hypothetical protein